MSVPVGCGTACHPHPVSVCAVPAVAEPVNVSVTCVSVWHGSRSRTGRRRTGHGRRRRERSTSHGAMLRRRQSVSVSQLTYDVSHDTYLCVDYDETSKQIYITAKNYFYCTSTRFQFTAGLSTSGHMTIADDISFLVGFHFHAFTENIATSLPTATVG